MSTANPFSGYLATLDVLLYPAPSPGFKTRTILLSVVFGLGILMACCQFALYTFEGRRRNSNVFWAFRVVQRSSGGLIVTNTKLFGTFFSIFNLSVQLAYIRANFAVFADHTPQTHLYDWRALPTVALLAQGWLLSWGLLQAYILTQDTYALRSIGPRTMNVLFVGGGLLFLCSAIATATWNATAGKSVWEEYVSLAEALTTLEGSWTPGSSGIASLLQLSPLVASLKKASSSYQLASSVEFGFAGGVAFGLSLLNVGGISLTRLLRRQISLKSRQIGQSSGLATAEASTGFKSQASDLPSRSKIRAMAKDSLGGADGELAKQLVVLQKAERDLLYTSAAQSIVTTLATAFCITIVVTTQSGIILTDWKILELATTGVQWLYATTLLLVFTLLNLNTLLREHSPKVDKSSEMPAETSSTAEMAFSDFFPKKGRSLPFPTCRPPGDRISSVGNSECSEKDEGRHEEGELFEAL